MDQVEIIIAVQKMEEYIDEHIYEKITLKQLATAGGYSPWYAAKIFKEVTGNTPFDYIRNLRLTKAALVLRDEKSKVIDVALDFVFDSHEGFTRAFSKKFGIAPKKYSKKVPPIQLFMPEKAYDTYKALNKKGEIYMSGNSNSKTVFVQIIERPERKVLLKRAVTAEDYFKYCDEVGCEVWGMLTSVKEALYEPIGMWLPQHLIKDGTSKYVQGVELPMDYDNEIPEGYDLIELPPCKMMVFQGEPFEDDDFAEAITEIWDHIEKFNPEIYGYKWAEEAAPRFQLIPLGYRGYIEARPVVEIENDKN